MASNMIGNLAVNLTMQTAAFQKGATIAEKRAAAMNTKMQGIGNSIKGIGAGLVAGFAAAGLGQIVTDAFEMGSSLVEAAAKVGVTVEALQEMRYVAEQNGVSIDTMEGSLNKMTKTLGALKLGSAGAIETFKQLGLTASSFEGLDPTASFSLIVDALARVKDETIRAALGNQVFGRSYAELKPIVDIGAAGIKAAAEEKRKDGLVSEEQAKKLDYLADSWSRFKTNLGVAAANGIANLALWSEKFEAFFQPIDTWADETDKVIYDWAVGLEASFNKMHDAAYNKVIGIGPAIMKGFGVAGTAAKNLIGDFLNLNVKGVQYVANMVTGVGRWIVDKLGAIFESAKAKIRSVVDMFDWMDNEVVRNSYVPDMVIAVNQWFGTMEKGMAGSAGRATQSVTEKMAAMRSDVAGILTRLFPEAAAIRNVEAEIAKLDEALASKDKIISLDVYRAGMSKLQKQLEELNATAKASALPPMPIAEGILNTDFGLLNEKIGSIGVAANDNADDVETSNVRVIQSYADMARSVLSSISGLAQSIKGGDILGILEGVLGVFTTLGSAGVFGGGIQANLNAPARAKGGPVSSGKTYMVGEKGPELFTSNRSGYITSNKNMNNSGRQSSVQIVPSPYFDVVVDGRILTAAPSIAGAGSSGAQSAMARRNSRRVA